MPRAHWLANGALALASAALTLCAAEVGVRIGVWALVPNVMVLDPELGWVHRPNVRRHYRTDKVDAFVETNAAGRRGPEYAGPPHGTRVLVLGDSFVDGLEVSNDDLFTIRLGALRPDLEVVNAGIGGYGTVQELLMLMRIQARVRPDLCVLMVYVNDLVDNITPFYAGIGPRPYLDADGTLHPVNWALFQPLLLPVPGGAWLHQHSLAAYLLRNRLFGAMSADAPAWRYVERWETSVGETRQWSLLEGQVRRLASRCPLVVGGIPTREAVRTKDTAFTDRLAEVAHAEGVDYIDLQPLLRPQDYYQTDIHWNADGHRIIAGALAAHLGRPGEVWLGGRRDEPRRESGGGGYGR